MKGMYSRLPRFVTINGERFIINTDFRIFIDFEEEMQGIDTKNASIKALKRFYPAFLYIQQKNYVQEAVEKFIWFYKCGKTEEIIKKSSKIAKKQIFSYKYDDLYIWGAYKTYGYDLTKDYIHWWKFRAIWLSLPSENEFVKIKGYRAYNGDDKDILELKEAYKLPKNEKEIADEIRRDAIFKSLQ